MPALFHDLTVRGHTDKALVRRSTLNALVKQLASRSLGVSGYGSKQLDDGVSFFAPASETADGPVLPWEISQTTGGYTFALGRVIGLTVNGIGSTFLIPKIGGVAINAPDPPPLSGSGEMACVELNVRFNRGSGTIPYSTSVHLTSHPKIKWIEDITQSIGVIDGTAYSYATHAIPLFHFSLSGDTITRLRWTNIANTRSFVTNLLG